MKKKIFTFMFFAIMFAIEPVYAMEKEPKEQAAIHIKIAKAFTDAWDSLKDSIFPHECSVCKSEILLLDSTVPSENGAFTSIPDDLIRRIMIQLPLTDICSFALISKKMCNALTDSAFWKAVEGKNKVHVSKSLCPKKMCLENYGYYYKNTAGLFEKHENGITYSVKNPIFLSFMKTPCESNWITPYMLNRDPPNEAKYYSFSIEQRQFELYLLHKKGELPLCVREAQGEENCDKETLFTVVAWESFLAGSFADPTCFVRELKPNAQ